MRPRVDPGTHHMPRLRPSEAFEERTAPGSGGALLADELSFPLLGQLAAVVHQEAARAGELVGLARKHPNRQLLAGEVGAGEFHPFRDLVGVDVYGAGALVDATRLQLLQAVLVDVLVGLTRAVVIGGHLADSIPLVLCLVARYQRLRASFCARNRWKLSPA